MPRSLATAKRFRLGEIPIGNSGFESAPTLVAAQTGLNYIDGTAAGSATNNSFGAWAVIVGSVSAYDNAVKFSGNNSLRLSTPTIAATCVVAQGRGVGFPSNRYDCMVLLPSTSYTLTGYIKTNNAAAAAAFFELREYTVNGLQLASTASPKLGGTTDWTFVTLVLTTTSTTYYGRILLRNNVTGNISDVWYDSLELTATTSPTRATVTGRILSTNRLIA